jgi:preprotein translocase subunit SecF
MSIELFRNPNYDFIGKRRWAYLLSAIFIAVGLISIAVKGLHYDIDFAGGTLVQIRFADPPAINRLRTALNRMGLGEGVIQEFGDPREFIVRLPLAGTTSSENVTKRVQEALGTEGFGSFEIRRVEFVGPQVGRDLQIQALYAVVAGLVGILLYIALRFDLKGGVAAVVAVFHDVLVSLGALSLTNREFSLPVLAAILTIIGYSVNDTIVAYDRLRENRGKLGAQKGLNFAQQMNLAINQTLSRTVLTALTVFFSTAILLVFGGKVLEDMAFTLFIGVITGTYSTVYIAGALVVEWTQWAEGRVRRTKKAVAKA